MAAVARSRNKFWDSLIQATDIIDCCELNDPSLVDRPKVSVWIPIAKKNETALPDPNHNR
ncbi:MAG: hypothetical protein JGK24_09180 [Microcoleus sp. PH2017_29_MFU_D_A]|uniref:hypothetical protein n=1 Tax=unclassified Microcoleus TaxID=2642155 RepID=UPI001D2CA745|nr:MULTISPECIES: hypothetical protein [unclassified Microcoleus]MCC3420422.1 hypothetical protein [Microcoleus sp. PH2017_07_MST_O_A]MCC3431398.1 hypothetical protein [Microcoleus sp. PH2017_04_SCI_O_A]MCC3442568.1 hypothetical protein [Microcoleus sp. PH2017_03_ELD_O_A]MCC3467667.1 hypothetical protein [Microcoleus sp. PH2017_06_SFM_O_A]MCC3504146.1 hypothetical protein [Microcoleus sp. PH2017_19_SFW_U_A]MCC3508517.1 hypothetical protein [Microcoleus sp. PH2017_17_BER_D_A]MCC3599271.1 hypot